MESDSSSSEVGHIGKVELSAERDVKADQSLMGAIRSLQPAETESRHDSVVAGGFQELHNRPLLDTLPVYGSAAFWEAIEEPDRQKILPLELLVRSVRLAVAYGDVAARNRIIEVILRRTQVENEYWTYSVLKYVRVSADERSMLADDLYADLCECLIRRLLDAKRFFWEENFQHCLRFERQHVYSAFMRREGRLNAGSHLSTGVVEDPKGVEADGTPSVPRRIPRGLMYRMDAAVVLEDGETLELLIEDERAQEAFQAIEREDVLRLILELPQKLKAVVWLIFWEGRTEKDTAQVLGITDRTVRNRLREALKLLRGHAQGTGQAQGIVPTEFEGDSVYG